ncbi:glycosyltransferase family 4 protein [Gloeothece verrucosa]|uniref:Glycosyl transferase group 1 n=1 Tax=Gloeothece verrucosa (strain PCC 7822) TaxID=497965 RepID=E0UK02_GLOV7|nr:glycosyltransferase family 4 protein [Gloeothece verrucosa]ADN14638.1 glycosyl transferase group 1 [Gloeothece verrucosa PCC 7822]
MKKKLKVLLIIEQCNPEWSSVPLVGYNYYKEISQLVDCTLVTHGRNEEALQKFPEHKNIIYIHEGSFSPIYHKLVSSITFQGRVNWPLYNALCYPIYEEFNNQVYQQFHISVSKGDYDIVHAITPMMPRYPVKIIKACHNTPFLLGPVNGGVPFPPGFQKVARQEFAYFNFLRAVGRALIPGYVETYQQADKVLSGSTYTLNWLKDTFSIPDNRISLFYENGIKQEFIETQNAPKNLNYINLLFVGRLVPYKGADMLLEAISQLDQEIQNKIRLTIVGDGSEKKPLEQQVKELKLESLVKFTGWVKSQDIVQYYKNSDIFCFPSIREFGGAVVLEAMACGLPCIVVNNGGIGEYVTEETGFRIEPSSREYVVREVADKIQILVNDQTLRNQMSFKCVERVKDFEWGRKAEKIREIYEDLVKQKADKTLNSDLALKKVEA